jgi:hypothetical protein
MTIDPWRSVFKGTDTGENTWSRSSSRNRPTEENSSYNCIEIEIE